MQSPSTIRRAWLAVVALSLFAVACSGSTTTTISETTSAEPTAVPQAEATTEPQPEPTAAEVAEPTAVPTPPPTPTVEPTPAPATVFFSSELEPGDCFNRLPDNPPLTPPDKVSCDDLHEEEVYAKTVVDDGPDAPYPGEDELVDRASAFCNPATIEFAGDTWDVLPIETLLLFPLAEDWQAGDRTIMCSAKAASSGDFKIGTAAGGSITTGDVLVARANLLNEGVSFDEWAVVEQRDNLDSIGSLTTAQFDLPLRRPFGVPQGFVFNATAPDSDDFVTTTWGYNWQTQEFTDLGSILPGQEIASTIIVDGTVIFAARATPDDDWDLWTTASGDAEVLIGGDGDQQYPTVSPDGSKLVYQDNGDLWVANLDGTAALQLTDWPENEYESAVSPDGTTVVFASDRSGNDELWAVDIGGGEPVNLTNHPGDESWPAFSESGDYIYFTSDRLDPENSIGTIMVMNADGSNQSWFASTPASQTLVVPTCHRRAGGERTDAQRAIQLRAHRRRGGHGGGVDAQLGPPHRRTSRWLARRRGQRTTGFHRQPTARCVLRLLGNRRRVGHALRRRHRGRVLHPLHRLARGRHVRAVRRLRRHRDDRREPAVPERQLLLWRRGSRRLECLPSTTPTRAWAC